jgi:hypothetical protein
VIPAAAPPIATDDTRTADDTRTEIDAAVRPHGDRQSLPVKSAASSTGRQKLALFQVLLFYITINNNN